MKCVSNAMVLALLSLISTWQLSGCSKNEPAATSSSDTSDASDGVQKRDGHSKTAAGRLAGRKPEEHVRRHHPKRGHKSNGHAQGKHKHHKRGGRHGDAAAPQAQVKVGDKVPDVSVTGLGGKSVKLRELQKDKDRTRTGVVVLSFWCTTCHSCRDVEHLLARLSKEYRGRAAVIALAANADETAESVKAFLKKHGLALNVVLDRTGRTADLFGVRRTTTTVVIDGSGVLRYCGQFRQKGGGSAEAALKAVLAGQEVAVKTTPHYG